VPDYIKSTLQAFEIGLAFRKHPVDKDFILHQFKNILSSPMQLLTFLLVSPPQKKIRVKIFIPNSGVVCSGCTYG